MPRDGTMPAPQPQPAPPSREQVIEHQRNTLSARLMDMEIEVLLLRSRNAELERQLAPAAVEPQ